MSISQFGYPVTSTGGTMSQTAITPGSSPKSPLPPPPSNPRRSSSPPCCENGRPIMTNPLNGQTICSCQYNPQTAAALYNYPTITAGAARIPGQLEALYSSAFAAQAQGLLSAATFPPPGSVGGHPTGGAGGDPATAAALYAGLAPGYDFKGGLSSPAGLGYPFDPTMAAYPYGNGFLDPNARRKNATRESTATLKAWLSEHKKNPYPTKGEKIMLAIITKMTLTQVSTWFANARRRLKKDHKMTWEPRNRMDDDDDDEDRDDVSDGDDVTRRDHDDVTHEHGEDENISVDSDDEESINPLRHMTSSISSTDVSRMPGERSDSSDTGRDRTHTDSNANKSQQLSPNMDKDSSNRNKNGESNTSIESSPQKPKIWSMAEIATSNKNDSPSNIRSTDSLLSHPHLQSSHQNKLPSPVNAHAHAAQMLHPAWRGAAAHPYFQAHMLQSRLAALSQAAHPAAAAARLPTNPFPVAAMTSQLRHGAVEQRSATSAFVPIANLSKSPTSS